MFPPYSCHIGWVGGSGWDHLVQRGRITWEPGARCPVLFLTFAQHHIAALQRTCLCTSFHRAHQGDGTCPLAAPFPFVHASCACRPAGYMAARHSQDLPGPACVPLPRSTVHSCAPPSTNLRKTHSTTPQPCTAEACPYLVPLLQRHKQEPGASVLTHRSALQCAGFLTHTARPRPRPRPRLLPGSRAPRWSAPAPPPSVPEAPACSPTSTGRCARTNPRAGA